jgi:hypothetical protein
MKSLEGFNIFNKLVDINMFSRYFSIVNVIDIYVKSYNSEKNTILINTDVKSYMDSVLQLVGYYIYNKDPYFEKNAYIWYTIKNTKGYDNEYLPVMKNILDICNIHISNNSLIDRIYENKENYIDCVIIIV